MRRTANIHVDEKPHQLFLWSSNGNIQALRDALESGANINIIDPVTTDSPLMMACRFGHTDIVRLFLNYGAKNDPHPDYGQTALHAAISEGHFNAAATLLEVAHLSGAAVIISNLADTNGQTPLHVASTLGATELVELLLSYESRLACVDVHGQTSLHLCGGSGNKSCLAMLLDHGGDELLEKADANGNTVLHHTAFGGHLDCVRLLLESAADVAALNHKGQTAHSLCKLRGHWEIARLLAEYGSEDQTLEQSGQQHPPTQQARPTEDALHSRQPLSLTALEKYGAPPLVPYDHPGALGGGPPSLQRSISTPSKSGGYWGGASNTPNGCDSVGFQHHLFASDTDVLDRQQKRQPHNWSSISTVGLQGEQMLPRPHTVASPAITSRGNGVRQHASSLLAGSEAGWTQPAPSTPDSSAGYITAQNSELKPAAGVQSQRILPIRERSVSGRDSRRPSAVGASALLGGLGVEVYTKQKIINRADGVSSPAPQHSGSISGTPPLQPSTPDASSRKCSAQLFSTPSPTKPADNGGSDFADPLEQFVAEGREWRVYLTEEGHRYFLDMAHEHSQWDDPREHGVQDGSSAECAVDGSDSFHGGVHPPTSPSPQAAERAIRSFGFLSASPVDCNDSAGEKARVVPLPIAWGSDAAAVDSQCTSPEVADAPTSAVEQAAVAVREAAPVPATTRPTGALPGRISHSKRSGFGDDEFGAKVRALQQKQQFSLADDLAKDLRVEAMAHSSSSTSGHQDAKPHSAAEHSQSISVADSMAEEGRCADYLRLMSSGGGTLLALREAMEAAGETQDFMLRVFAQADELLLDSCGIGDHTSTEGPPLSSALKTGSADKTAESLDTLRSDATLGKYAKMACMGVPHPNVLAKMKMDAVAVADRNRLMLALGAETEAEPSQAKADSGSGSSRVEMGRKASGNFQTLHWNALPVSKLKNSIWAFSANESLGEGTDSVAETELQELEKLFSSNGTASVLAAGSSGLGKAKDSDQLKVLERRRAQNVAIGLVSLRAFGSHLDLLKAVCSLDSLGGRLTADHLDNLRSLLPTEAEMKRVHEIAGSKHPAEIFMQAAVMFYPELPRRLTCFLSCQTYEGACSAMQEKFTKIVNCCNQVLSSSRLAKLLRKMLAVGNVMNEGTNRGHAVGFTLDSLLKMVDTKGADKRTSVLDVVVRSLYDRGEERVLEVIEDLSLVEEGARLSVVDAAREFSGLEKQLAFLRAEYQRNMANSDRHVFSSPTAKTMVSHFGTRLESYLSVFDERHAKLLRWRGVLRKKSSDVLQYFGEDTVGGDTTDTIKVFTVLQKFRSALLFCKESAEWKIYRSSQQDDGCAVPAN